MTIQELLALMLTIFRFTAVLLGIGIIAFILLTVIKTIDELW